VNVFHLSWVTFLHYLVKLEMLIGHVVPLSCYRKKHQNLSHLSCGLQIRQIWIQRITVCEEYCKGRCTKHVSLTWTNWDSEQSGAIRPKTGLWKPHANGVVDSSRAVMCFCTPSLATFPTCGYTLACSSARLMRPNQPF